MKKTFEFVTVLIFSFLTMLFAACSDISTDAYVFEKESVIVYDSSKNVQFSVSSRSAYFSNYLSSVKTGTNVSAREITPPAYNSSELNFYLGGVVRHTKNQTENVVVQKVSFKASEDSDSSGVVTANLNSLTYELTLLAIPASADTTTLTETTLISDLVPKAVLFGSATADLKYNDGEEVKFYLSSDSLSGSGEYDISLYLKDWSAKSLATVDSVRNSSVVSNVNIGLYKLSGGSLLSEDYFVEDEDFSSALSSSSAVSYHNSTVPAGTYNLVVSFSYNGKLYTYSDKIIILSYQTTSATIGIPDLLQVVPSAPTNFKQGYLIPSSDESDYYRVAFEWEDNSNTETSFEIQLIDVSENENATAVSANNETFWNNNSSSSNTISYTSSFDNSSEWFAGSLSKNSTNAVFYMLLGKRFYARIRAINNIGGSEWCYALSDAVSVSVAAGASTAEEAVLSYAKTFSSTAFNSPVINLFRLKYNLSGGTLSPSITTIYYFDQNDGGNPILCPDGIATSSTYNSGSALTLVNGTLSWSHWACTSANGDAYQNSFTRCTSVADFDSSTTYYVPWTQEADVNGSTVIYKPAEPQPSEFTAVTYSNYYVSDGKPANYVGYKNLNLYAVFEDTGGSGVAADYSIKNNLTFSVNEDGTPVAISSRSFAISSSSTTLSIVFNYTDDSFTYDSVSLTISEDGGSEIGTFSPAGQAFTIPVSKFTVSSSYNLKITASKAGGTYTSTLFMDIN